MSEYFEKLIAFSSNKTVLQSVPFPNERCEAALHRAGDADPTVRWYHVGQFASRRGERRVGYVYWRPVSRARELGGKGCDDGGGRGGFTGAAAHDAAGAVAATRARVASS